MNKFVRKAYNDTIDYFELVKVTPYDNISLIPVPYISFMVVLLHQKIKSNYNDNFKDEY